MKRTLLALSILMAFAIAACQTDSPSAPTGSPMTKAVVTRDLPFSIPILNTCCWDEEYVTLEGTMKLVVNDNGAHGVVKDLTGTCIWGGHTYTVEGATTFNATYQDDKHFQVVMQIKMINDQGCSATVKLHFKWVYSEADGWTLQFDKSELICDTEDTPI
jgi:hypothetical protein